MESDQYKMIINNLKEAIEESGMKQKAVAERVGMTPRKLNDILCFRQRLGAEYIPLFCSALQVQPSRFFDGVSM